MVGGPFSLKVSIYVILRLGDRVSQYIMMRCHKSSKESLYLDLFSSGGILVSSSLDFSGDDTAFLYPDIRTTMVGRFAENGRMVEARLGEVCGIRKPRLNHGCSSQTCRKICPLTPVFAIQNVSCVIIILQQCPR